jgi:hypothetical protein
MVQEQRQVLEVLGVVAQDQIVGVEHRDLQTQVAAVAAVGLMMEHSIQVAPEAPA